MKPTKENLQLELTKVNKARVDIMNQLDEIKEKEAAPKLKAMVGKTFVFENSYSHDSKWFLYTKILSFEGNEFTLLTFQTDSYGKITIEIDTTRADSNHHLFQHTLREKTFTEQWNKIITKMKTINQ